MGVLLTFVLFVSQVFGAIQPVVTDVKPAEQVEDFVELTIDDLENVELVEKATNETETAVNDTDLQEELKLLENADEDVDMDYIEKNFNESNISVNDTEEVEVEEYDEDDEEEEITVEDGDDEG